MAALPYLPLPLLHQGRALGKGEIPEDPEGEEDDGAEAEGKSNEEISRIFRVSVRTVQRWLKVVEK